ncbi:MAG: hypothetical protein WC220_15615, partial [Pedobacter sp.]
SNEILFPGYFHRTTMNINIKLPFKRSFYSVRKKQNDVSIQISRTVWFIATLLPGAMHQAINTCLAGRQVSHLQY